jgi:hypothetical protein
MVKNRIFSSKIYMRVSWESSSSYEWCVVWWSSASLKPAKTKCHRRGTLCLRISKQLWRRTKHASLAMPICCIRGAIWSKVLKHTLDITASSFLLFVGQTEMQASINQCRLCRDRQRPHGIRSLEHGTWLLSCQLLNNHTWLLQTRDYTFSTRKGSQGQCKCKKSK